MFLEGKEYQTIWKTAHIWAGHSPDETDPHSLPEKVKDLIQQIILGYQRGDLALRTKSRFTISMKEESALFDIFVTIPFTLKLRKCLTKGIFNKPFLDSYSVQRGELLRWCEKEYLSPPSFWAPTESADSPPSPTIDESDDSDGWYENLTERRKQIVTSLEIAKRLWQIKPDQSYEEILKHQDMARHGYPKIFSLNSFKNWARPVASDYAKNGGRPKESKK